MFLYYTPNEAAQFSEGVPDNPAGAIDCDPEDPTHW